MGDPLTRTAGPYAQPTSVVAMSIQSISQAIYSQRLGYFELALLIV
jgi:hypothetical protein